MCFLWFPTELWKGHRRGHRPASRGPTSCLKIRVWGRLSLIRCAHFSRTSGRNVFKKVSDVNKGVLYVILSIIQGAEFTLWQETVSWKVTTNFSTEKEQKTELDRLLLQKRADHRVDPGQLLYCSTSLHTCKGCGTRTDFFFSSDQPRWRTNASSQFDRLTWSVLDNQLLIFFKYDWHHAESKSVHF